MAEVKKERCLRCEFEWEKRVAGRPLACPECHSRRWDRPRSTARRDQPVQGELAQGGKASMRRTPKEEAKP